MGKGIKRPFSCIQTYHLIQIIEKKIVMLLGCFLALITIVSAAPQVKLGDTVIDGAAFSASKVEFFGGKSP